VLGCPGTPFPNPASETVLIGTFIWKLGQVGSGHRTMSTNFPGAALVVRIARETVDALILTAAIVLLWLGLVHIALAVARAGMRIGARRGVLIGRMPEPLGADRHSGQALRGSRLSLAGTRSTERRKPSASFGGGNLAPHVRAA
jgi:hypothetical protein